MAAPEDIQAAKRIFDSVLAFHDWDNWHRMVQNVSRRSRYLLPADVVPRYNSACFASITFAFGAENGSLPTSTS